MSAQVHAGTENSIPDSTGRWWRRRRVWLALLLGILAAGFFWRERGRRPLTLLQLPDGTQLKVWAVTTGTNHEFIVRHQFPPGAFVARWIKPWQQELLLEKQGRGVVVWLSRFDPAGREPLDLGRVNRFVAVDEHGWTHPMRGISRAVWLENEQHLSRVLETQAGYLGDPLGPGGLSIDDLDVQKLEARDYGQVIFAVLFPAMAGKTLELQAIEEPSKKKIEEDPLWKKPVDAHSYSLQVPIPENQFLDLQMPHGKLPQTDESNDLAVTLTGLRAERLPMRFTDVLPLRVVPEFSMSWRGGDAAGWEFASGEPMQIKDCFGNWASADFCTVSPWQGPWTLDVELHRKPQSALRPGQRVRTKPQVIPPEGEIRDGDFAMEADGVQVQLLKVFGKGHHEISLGNYWGMQPGGPGGHYGEGGVVLARIAVSNNAAVTVQAGTFAALFELRNLNNKTATVLVEAAGSEEFSTGNQPGERGGRGGDMIGSGGQKFSTDQRSSRVNLPGEPAPGMEQHALLLVWPKERVIDPPNWVAVDVHNIPESPQEVEFEITIDRPMKYRFVVEPPELPKE